MNNTNLMQPLQNSGRPMQNLEWIHQSKTEKICTGLLFKAVQKENCVRAKFLKVKSCKCVECSALIDSYTEDLANGIVVDASQLILNKMYTIKPIIDYTDIDSWHFEFVPLEIDTVNSLISV